MVRSQMSDDLQMPEDPFGEVIPTLTEDILLKNMVWNGVRCDLAPQVAKQIGLNPSSEDVEDEEHEMAHSRANILAMLQQPLGLLAHQAAKVLQGAMIVVHGDEAKSNPYYTIESLTPMIYQSAYSILTELFFSGQILLVQPMTEMVHMADQGDEEE